ncbi:unnamed protein product [Meloidogyne enterolobii]|uniref:Uncharacterized protein n=1 Tax=Meloidogyne enterolobii TaxID=390850 RepID=A0ACB1A544_MELEN
MTVVGEEAKEWTRVDAPLDERLIIGLLYLCSALFFLVLQFSVIFIIITYKDFRGHLCYRIMLFISIADSIQLVVHSYGGIICILNNSLSFFVEKAAGGLANSILMATMPICLVLSLNRLLVFLPSKLDETREERLFNWLIALSLLHGLPFFIIYLTPHSTIAFRYYTWDYVTIYNNSTWTWVGTSTAILPLPYITLTFLVYLAIFGVLILQRRKITTTKPKVTPTVCPTRTTTMYQHNTNLIRNQKNEQIPANVIPIEWSTYKPPQPPTTKNISPSTQNPIQHLIQHERRLLFQALVQFGVEFSLCLIWFYQMIGAPLPEGVAFNAFINWYWIFYNGFRPLVYLAMNKTVRKRLLALWLNQPQATLVDFGKLQRGAAPQGIRATPRLFSQNKQTQNYASGRMS